MKNKPLKEGSREERTPYGTIGKGEYWIKEECPRCGHQLYGYDSGQGAGILCSNTKCNYRVGG